MLFIVVSDFKVNSNSLQWPISVKRLICTILQITEKDNQNLILPITNTFYETHLTNCKIYVHLKSSVYLTSTQLPPKTIGTKKNIIEDKKYFFKKTLHWQKKKNFLP